MQLDSVSADANNNTPKSIFTPVLSSYAKEYADNCMKYFLTLSMLESAYDLVVLKSMIAGYPSNVPIASHLPANLY
jgi:hypothetical protein